MKIFFDTSPLINGHQGRGIGVYTKNLIAALRKIPTIGVQSGEVKRGGFECDLIHYPYFDFYFRTLPIRKKVKTIVTIHDTIPLIYKNEMKPGIRGELKFIAQKFALKNCSAIITDSQSSKIDIEKYLEVQAEKIHVTPLAVDQDFSKSISSNPASKKSLKLPEKYLLYVGDINYNKNIPGLIKAYSQAKNKGDLVIVSRALSIKHIPESQKIIQEISHSEKKGKIHLLTNIDVKTLSSVYKYAHAYIQPSFYEGFGLPLLEAFEAGIPVLSSNTSSLPEVGGSAPLYFDPTSDESMKNAIEEGLSLSDSQRKKLIEEGALQSQKFNWIETAKSTVAVYKKVLS